MAKILLDITHYYVHKSKVFEFGHIFTGVADATSKDIQISVGKLPLHITFSVSVGGQSNVQIFEGADISSNGTALSAFNRNRQSTASPFTSLYYSPTINSTGTGLPSELIAGGTSNPARVGGAGLERPEYIFKPNTEYILRTTNNSGADIPINVLGNLYERKV